MKTLRSYFKPDKQCSQNDSTRRHQVEESPAGNMPQGRAMPSTTNPSLRTQPSSIQNAISPEELLNWKREEEGRGAVCGWLFSQQCSNKWAVEATPPGEGVILRLSRGRLFCKPDALKTDQGGLFKMVSALNVKVSRKFRLY